MQLNHHIFTPQALSKYLTSMDTACTSRSKSRDSVIIQHLGMMGDKDRGELIMHSTSKSQAPPSFRLMMKHFLIFTRYFLVDKVFSLSALSLDQWSSVSVMKLSSVTSRFPLPASFLFSHMVFCCRWKCFASTLPRHAESWTHPGLQEKDIFFFFFFPQKP